MRVLEERMLASGIPYTVIGGIKFYERKEIKDAVSYLKLTLNINDGVAFERIINLPKRGIGPTTINKFYAIAKDESISIPLAAKKYAETTKGNVSIKLNEFFEKLNKWHEELDSLSPPELMQKILIDSGYINMLKDQKNLENETRLESLDELINALQEFDSIEEFLDYISLVLDNADSKSYDRVTISTIHAAKGLEYHTVFIPGFEENILPHQKSVLEKGNLGIEEERRLCYVAITRAKREAYITFCNKRNMYGAYNMVYTTPSRFLQDLPKDCVKVL